jgi:uncharacterized protein (DUF1684 family)
MSNSILSLVLLVLFLGVPACNDSSPRDERKWSGKEARAPFQDDDPPGLADFRRAKDEMFREDGSPIPQTQRAAFTGLEYFPSAPDLIFRLPLERFEHPEVVKVMATGGETRQMLRYGMFRFEVEGVACSLAVFKSSEGNHLFIPFRDETSGNESYEVGRYLDLEEQSGDAEYLLDFNLAYNPYCAYNETYTCPMVPSENVLPVAIRAGEKVPPVWE